MKVTTFFVYFVIISKLISATSTEINITTHPQSKRACPGTVVHFNCQLSGTDVLPNWIINGKEYAPSTLPPSYYPGPDGLTVHVVNVQSHNVSFQCLFFSIPKSGLPVLISSDIAYLNILSENFLQLYTSTVTLKDPTLEQFYVKNGQLNLKWSGDEVEISKYNVILYTDDCINNHTIETVNGTILETTIANEKLINRDKFYLRIQACSGSICSRNGTALYIRDIEDPALQLSTITINANNSFVCFNTSIKDKCGTFSTVKISNTSYFSNIAVHFNRTSYFAYPFYNNSWMEYRLSTITGNAELCITNISNFLSEFMSERILINDQCSKSKDNCSAINTSLNYLEIGFQHILDIKENIPLPSVSSTTDSNTVSVMPFPSPTDNKCKCECTKSATFIAPFSLLLISFVINIIAGIYVCGRCKFWEKIKKYREK